MRSKTRFVPLSIVVSMAVFACSSSSSTSSTPGAQAIACKPTPVTAIRQNFFSDISASSGIQLDNFTANPPKAIPINDHSRLAFVDLDGDGYDDIVMHNLYPNVEAGIPFEHLVFINNKDKTFRDFSDASGLRNIQAGHFVFGDVDNDGDEDCFAGLDIPLTGSTSTLWLNDGSGHFTQKIGSGLEAISQSANGVFADFNGDGILDLFSGNGGTSEPGLLPNLFFGNGDGTFTNASGNLTGRVAQPGNGSVACDYDNDGDVDIFLSNYGVSTRLGWQQLWENDGSGHFTNVAALRGTNAQATGNYYLASTGYGVTPQPVDPTAFYGANGFGVDCADIDNDGNMDIWLASISHPDGADTDPSRQWSDPSQLLLNQGSSGSYAFKNVFLDRKLTFTEGDIDAAAVDFDNDGLIDLARTRDSKYDPNYTAYDQLSWFGLAHQEVDGTFTSVGQVSGINDDSGTTAATARMKAGQNMGWSDIDHDGDMDLLVGGRDDTGAGRANFLFENTIGQENGWIAIKLTGDGHNVNRDAIGARVTLSFANGKKMMREVKSSRGTYSSADSRVLNFGLADQGCTGTTSQVALDVRWTDGTTLHLDAGMFPLNQYIAIDYAKGLLTTAATR